MAEERMMTPADVVLSGPISVPGFIVTSWTSDSPWSGAKPAM